MFVAQVFKLESVIYKSQDWSPELQNLSQGTSNRAFFMDNDLKIKFDLLIQQ
jgi:hypothetical protein